ncbi:MAG: hypothetical protein E7463_10355 [Ruminococcaceae bacterium]|nr:hypothetical protein [Oscillospiraceae bacterium]
MGIRIDAFIREGTLFKTPCAAIGHNKDFPFFYNTVGGDKIISKAVFKVSNELYVLSADCKAESIHRQIAEDRQSFRIEKADTCRQIIKRLLDGNAADCFSLLRFAEKSPYGICQRQQDDQQQYNIRYLQVRSPLRSVNTAVKLHQYIKHRVQQKGCTQTELLLQFTSAPEQQNKTCRNGNHGKLTEY